MKKSPRTREAGQSTRRSQPRLCRAHLAVPCRRTFAKFFPESPIIDPLFFIAASSAWSIVTRYVGAFLLLYSFSASAQDIEFKIGEKMSLPSQLVYSNKGSPALGENPAIMYKQILQNNEISVSEIFLEQFNRDTMLSNCSVITSNYDVSNRERYVRAGQLMKKICTTKCPPNTCDPEVENCGPQEGCTKTCVDAGDGSDDVKYLFFLLSRSLCESLPRR